MSLVDFLHKMLDHLLLDNVMWGKLAANDQQIVETQKQLKELLMTTLETLQTYAKKLDDYSNAEAASLDALKTLITNLQAQIAAGTITPEQISAALDPVVAHIGAVSDNMAALAAGGSAATPLPTPVPSPEPL
jgi:predicted metal-dependent hydrolase